MQSRNCGHGHSGKARIATRGREIMALAAARKKFDPDYSKEADRQTIRSQPHLIQSTSATVTVVGIVTVADFYCIR